ncbi:RDD family protein [Cellulomonas soli]|uniref:RDD family protein n=1 Tax=Cellulomonas soli TaxID=931535 RepID=UPI003F87334B
MSVRRPLEQAVPASFARRVAAGLLDGLLAMLVVGAALVAVGGLARAGLVEPVAQDPSGGRVSVGDVSPVLLVPVLAAGVLQVVQWLLHGLRGWTVGRRLLGVRTLDAESRRPIGPLRVLLRGLVVAAGGLVLGVGSLVVLLSPLFDRSGRLRGWHDRAAGDEVLDVRGARDDALVVSSWSVPPLSPRVPGPPGELSLGPAPQEAGVVRGPITGAQPVVSGTGLVLAPLAQERQGPDLDTRAIPVVRPVTLAFGLHPELEVTRPRRTPEQEAQVAAPSVAARVSADIEMTDGRRVTVLRTALVGRNPQAEGDAQLIRVVDPGRSVSKTHLQIGVEPGGVWVCDRGSTNGTIVTLPDGAQVICGTDQQVRLREGSTVAFGDHGLRLLRAPGTAAAS